MKRISKLGIATIIVLAVVLALPTAALAIPGKPHAFHGNVTVEGNDAPDGTTVSAWVEDTELFASTVTSEGEYGVNPAFKVLADDPDTPLEGAVDGDIIIFKVGTQVAVTDPLGPIKFKGGEVSQVNLTITGPAPQPLSAEAGGPYYGTPGANIALSGFATGGTPDYTYAWDLDNNATYETSGKNVSRSWSTAGTYTIGLQVTDSATPTSTKTDTATVTVKVSTPAPSGDSGGGGGGGGASYYYADMNLFGIEGRFLLRDGEIVRTIEATSENGMLTITIPKGTVAEEKDGKRLKGLEAAVDKSPPDPPEDAHVIGLAYNFGPPGATFDPPITLTWSYDPDALPEGVAEEDLVLAYYDEEAGEWVELDCVVDTENKTITASVSHFTTFTIIGAVTPPPLAPAAFSVTNLLVKPLEIQIKDTVTITVSVANTGGTKGSYTVVLKINEVKEAEKRVTVAAGKSQSVSFGVSKEDAGTYNIAVDGLSESFTVVAPAPVVVPAPPAPAPPVPAPPAPAPPEVIPPTAPPVEPGGLPTWAIVLIAVGAAIIAGLVFWFIKERDRAR